jgi:hypothetical protein
MKTIVKIIKKSIRKNPNAGNDTTLVPMGWNIEFSTDISYDDLPDYIKKYTIETHRLVPDDPEYHGNLKYVDDKLIEFAQAVIKNGNRFVIRMNREIQTIHHFPEPKYLYKYENPKIECSNCHSMVAVNNIEEDEVDDNMVKICPICGSFNTFEYKYEKIQDVLKK